MKIIKILFNSIVAFIIIFILINIFISYFWELKTNYKINKMNPYTDTVLMFLGLNSQEGLQLYKETWINRKYDYDQFTEYAEHKTLNNKYLNISSENGRKILNNKNCTRNFFFYGSSVTFGYNVTDEQTHPSYFKKILDENHTQSYCVYNYGRAGYDSTRENILFLKHLLNKKIKKRDFIFFIDGSAESGNKDGINTQFLRRAQRIISQKYWDMYKHTFPFLIESLPVFQLVTRAKQKFNIPIAAYSVSGEYSMIKKASEGSKAKEKELCQEVLTSMKRAGADLIITYWAKDIIKWFDIIAESAIPFSVNLIVGFPGETREKVFDTIELVRKIRNYDTLTVSIFTPYHGTPLRDLAVRNGWLDDSTITVHTTSSSLLKMPSPYLSSKEIDALFRVLPLYTYFPKSDWPEIKKAEQFDTAGNKIYEKYASIYTKEFLGENQDVKYSLSSTGGTGCKVDPKSNYDLITKAMSDDEIALLRM